MSNSVFRAAACVAVAGCGWAARADIVVGIGEGGLPLVSVHSYQSGAMLSSFLAYPQGFLGGVRVGAGDVNGDGVADIVTGAGPGGMGHVKSFSRTGGLMGSFHAYGPNFTGGVFVGSGDWDRSGPADLVTGTDAGAAAHVKAFSGATGGELASFFAFTPSFTGGVRVAAGDVDNDGHADIIAGAGPGGLPQVQVYSGANGALLSSFAAFDPGFVGGVFVAGGDVDGDRRDDIITAADAGGMPHVRVFSGATGQLLRSFLAYDQQFSGGVRVAAGDLNGDGLAEIVTGAGPGAGPHVKVFDGATGQMVSSFMAGSPSFLGGVYVAVPAPGAGSLLMALGALAARRRRRG